MSLAQRAPRMISADDLVLIREYPSPDIRGPQPQNAHPDSTFSSHVHNDWTYAQLGDYPTPWERGETQEIP